MSSWRQKIITRRDFLRGTACATLATAMGLNFDKADDRLAIEARERIEPVRRAKVVLVRDADAIDKKGRINDKVIQHMLDRAVTTLFGKEDPVEAWRILVAPSDKVGVKSNVWGPLPTPKEVEQAIKRRIMEAGVPERSIGIDDRGILRNHIFLKATALVNVRPFRTHHWSGVGGCIKNYIMFVSYPPFYHGDSCANLGAIWKLPIVKNKTRLNILILLKPLFHGIGPHHFDPKYTWEYKGIAVGTDPVALDAIGLHLFQVKRFAYFGEHIPLSPPAKHIAIADTRYKIGTSDLRQIELVKLGWLEEVLI